MNAHTLDHAALNAVSQLDDDALTDLVVQQIRSRARFRSVRLGVEELLILAVGLSSRTDAELERTAPAATTLERARIESAAEAHILDHPMLDSRGVSDVLRRAGAARSAAQRLRSDGTIVGLKIGNRYLYPAFQFDQERAEVRPHVAHVNTMLEAAGDPWGVASWWLTPSSRLPAGTSPAELAVHDDPASAELVVNIAESLLDD